VPILVGPLSCVIDGRMRGRPPARAYVNVIQCQLGHANLGITSVYLQDIDNAEIIDTSTRDEHR
jgi:hypothetical protein